MTVRFGIVGTGSIANAHARGISQTEGAQLVAVVGSSPLKASGFAAAHGGGRALPSVEALASAPDVDAVVLATPNALHQPHGELLLRAGKDLLVDKPMAMSAAGALSMWDVARKHNRRILVGHMWRFDREALWLRERLERIGRIVKTKSYGVHVDWGPSGWFLEPQLAGGGALIDMGVHAIDTTRFLLGDPQPISVYARIETVFGDYAVDDLGVVVINWDGGAVSLIESGWHNPHMDGAEASTQLFGTDGYARLYPTTLGDEVPDLPARQDHCDQHMYTGQIGELVDAITTQREPAAGPEVGHTVMRICDAAYESARTGEVVRL